MVIIITAIIKNLKLKTTIPKRQTDFLKAIRSHKKQSRELLTTANLGCLINDILVFGGRYRNWPFWKPREIYPKAIRFCITLLGKTLKAVQKKILHSVCLWQSLCAHGFQRQEQLVNLAFNYQKFLLTVIAGKGNWCIMMALGYYLVMSTFWISKENWTHFQSKPCIKYILLSSKSLDVSNIWIACIHNYIKYFTIQKNLSR